MADEAGSGMILGSSRPTALLTDLYQVTMSYAHYRQSRHEDEASFDLHFRKTPFGGGFAVLAGVEMALEFISSFSFTDSDICFLRDTLGPVPDVEGFLSYLSSLSPKDVLTVHAMKEGSICFGFVPLLTLTGPLALCQLLETPLLNMINFATLAATNALRFRRAAGPRTTLLEFGLRRAQGPDGAMTASRSAYVGGFDATSNVQAARAFGIPAAGTHAHSFVCSFSSLADIGGANLEPSKEGTHKPLDKSLVDFLLEAREKLDADATPHDGELAAFCSYACAFPNGSVFLVDTYDTLRSGVPNAAVVSYALVKLGYTPRGVRLDSGDLVELSRATRALLKDYAERLECPQLASLTIVASDGITEEKIAEFNKQGHEMTAYGIGTHLVTCKSQPALGGVYKLTSMKGEPRIKLSQVAGKMTVPGAKNTFRGHAADGSPIFDIMCSADEGVPTLPMNAYLLKEGLDASPEVIDKTSVGKLSPLMVAAYEGGKLKLACSAKLARAECDAQSKIFSEKFLDMKTAENPNDAYPVYLSEALFALTKRLVREAQIDTSDRGARDHGLAD